MWKPFQAVLHVDPSDSSCLLSVVRPRSKLVLCLTGCALLWASLILLKASPTLNFPRWTFARPQNFLDGCRHVYIDMGTNIGVQIRKLYQPELYKNAPVLALFREIFGNDTARVCSVGFEANPVHDTYLREFEAYCVKRGWRVKIFTSTAVSTEDGNVSFFMEPGNDARNQWGASLEAGRHRVNVTVASVNLESWIKRYVFTRVIPLGSTPPKIMIKSDIEGHDPTVLTNLILNGVYCSIDLILGEHLSAGFRESLSQLQKFAPSCKTKLLYMDDETYFQSRFPFRIPNEVKPFP